MRLPTIFPRKQKPIRSDAPLLGFDLETTSVDPRSALPVSYAFVETVAYGALAPPNFSEYELINPGVPIPAETTRIHGITDQQVATAKGLVESVERIGQILVSASRRHLPVVGMNVVYDLTIIDTLWRAQTGRGLKEHGWQGAPVIDILVLDHYLDRYRAGKRNLGQLCVVYQVDPRFAHDATSDVLASLDITRKLLNNPFLKTLDPFKLTEFQKKWRADWATQYSQHRVDKNEPALPQDEADWPLRRLLQPGEVVPAFVSVPSRTFLPRSQPSFPDPNLAKETVDQLREVAKSTADPHHPLYAQQVHFTGTFSTPRAELQTKVMLAGGEVAGPLAATTAYLVVGHQDPKLLKPGEIHSSRYLKAQALQADGSPLQMIDEANLNTLLLPPPPPLAPPPTPEPPPLETRAMVELPARVARTL